jgi:hypothetical protein
MPFIIKQNDTRPIYMAALKENFGQIAEAPIDLTNATAVYFIIRPREATDVQGPKLRALATIEDAANGIVSYTWQVGDTDTTAVYDVEFEINWNDGGIETVPNDGYLTLTIEDDLG